MCIRDSCPTSMTLAKDQLMDIFATATKVEPSNELAHIIGVKDVYKRQVNNVGILK